MHFLLVNHFFIFLSLFISGNGNSQPAGQKISREEYIAKYKMVAVEDMLISGVPASITLAQAAFESDNGNSPLATEANNHFGIKCHDWDGKKYYHDDDAKQECFRVYSSALDSFNDHSNFLKNRPRYSFLFQLPRDDYRAWANGLKKAGYATSPVYADKLIQIIEDYKLYELDQVQSISKMDKIEKIDRKNAAASTERKEISLASKSIQFTNGVKYIVVQKGDSYEKIEKEYDLHPWQLYKYNDLAKTAPIADGQKIYLQPKRRKPREEFHTVQSGETMYTVSQRYAVKLKLLYRRNRMKPGEAVKPGQRLWLRKKKKVSDT